MSNKNKFLKNKSNSSKINLTLWLMYTIFKNKILAGSLYYKDFYLNFKNFIQNFKYFLTKLWFLKPILPYIYF